MALNGEEKNKRMPYINGNICYLPLGKNIFAICDSYAFETVKDKIWQKGKYNLITSNTGIYPKTISLQSLLFPNINLIKFLDGNNLNWQSYNVASIRKECIIENDICYIPLNNGQMAICDSKYKDIVSQCNWHMSKQGYAKCGGGGNNRRLKTQYLHKLLFPNIKTADHINRDKLDNRECNIRPADKIQNSRNRNKFKNNTTGYKGVAFDKDRNAFSARISYGDGQSHRIGKFLTAIEAARAYDKKAKEVYGEFAVLNFPDEIKEQSNG